MIIADIDYLTSVSATATPQVSGQGALAISSFFAFANGQNSHTGTVANNQTAIFPHLTVAHSSVSVYSVASGTSASTSASASSFASVSKPNKWSRRRFGR